MTMLRRIVEWNRRASRRFDERLPPEYQVDGNQYFVQEVVPHYLCNGQRVYDVGGGRHPCISLETKKNYELSIVGIDIDRNELDAAPQGVYDEVRCADVRTFRGSGDGDLLICQALLEHVPNVDEAFQAIASILKPGGRALIFVPARNAVFARLNLLLPHELKRAVLFAIYPDARNGQGFRSYYHRCTPADFRAMAGVNSLEIEREWIFWCSQYFSFCTPAHVAWRLAQRLARNVVGNQAAETFSMVLRKTAAPNEPVRS